MTTDQLVEYFKEFDARAKHAGDGAWWFGTCDSICAVAEEELGAELAPFAVVMWGSFRGLGYSDGHCWLEHPDGTIVDPTSAQYKGHDHIAVIPPDDSRQAWYRNARRVA